MLNTHVLFWNIIHIIQLLSNKYRFYKFFMNNHRFIQKFSNWQSKNINIPGRHIPVIKFPLKATTDNSTDKTLKTGVPPFQLL